MWFCRFQSTFEFHRNNRHTVAVKYPIQQLSLWTFLRRCVCVSVCVCHEAAGLLVNSASLLSRLLETLASMLSVALNKCVQRGFCWIQFFIYFFFWSCVWGTNSLGHPSEQTISRLGGLRCKPRARILLARCFYTRWTSQVCIMSRGVRRGQTSRNPDSWCHPLRCLQIRLRSFHICRAIRKLAGEQIDLAGGNKSQGVVHEVSGVTTAAQSVPWTLKSGLLLGVSALTWNWGPVQKGVLLPHFCRHDARWAV